MNHKPWQAIFDKYKIHKHNFSKEPYVLTAEQIKKATAHFSTTSEREVRVLCKQDSREDRPEVFEKSNLFLLPIKNGMYVILEGEGYVDIPEITTKPIIYQSKLDFELETSQIGNSEMQHLDFELETSQIGNSEMQHLDFAYATSLIRSFMNDQSLVLTVRGRKYTPKFDFTAGVFNHKITVESVQTEVDAGYEGKKQIVLIEAKNSQTKNTIIRQLYYPYRQWQYHSSKKINVLFFEKRHDIYSLWNYEFSKIDNYSSIKLLNSNQYEIRT
jgi:hypothetical protein